MKEEDIDVTILVRKYERFKKEKGSNIYFDADEFVLLADYYIEEENYEEFCKVIDQGLHIHPKNEELILHKIKYLVQEEKYQEAISHFDDISDVNNVDLSLLKIDTFLHLELKEQAYRYIDELLVNKTFETEDLYYFIVEIGYILNNIEEYSEAIFFLEKSFEFKENNEEVYIDLSYSYEMLDQLSKAIFYINKLLDINPYSHEGWVNIGMLYARNKEYTKSIEAFDFAITINEEDLNPLKMKGLTLLLDKKFDAAIDIFETCIKNNHFPDSVYEALIDLYKEKGLYDKMIDIIDLKEKDINNTSFDNTSFKIQRALVYILKNEIDLAQSIYNNIFNTQTKDSYKLNILGGEIAIYKKDLKLAEIFFLKANEQQNNSDELILKRLSDIYILMKFYEKSIYYLEQIPKLDEIKYILAYCYFMANKEDQFKTIINDLDDKNLFDLLNEIYKNQDVDFSTLKREKIISMLNLAFNDHDLKI